jgi:phage gpG-like protein
MAMSVKGTGQLRRLALAVQSMPRRVRKDAAEIAQRGIAALIDDQFDAKRDPYGVAWKPPKTGETMQKTGRLRRGFSVVIRPGSGQGLALEISNREEYAHWLQSGTEKMTARRLVPGATLPPAWQAVLRDAYRQALEKWFASARQ